MDFFRRDRAPGAHEHQTARVKRVGISALSAFSRHRAQGRVGLREKTRFLISGGSRGGRARKRERPRARQHPLAREGRKALGSRAAEPLDQERFDAIVLMVRRHHDVGFELHRFVGKRLVAELPCAGFDAVAFGRHRHADRPEGHPAAFALRAAVGFPLIRIGREPVVHVDGGEL